MPDTLKTVSSLSEDGKHLYCKLVNLADKPEELFLHLDAICPSRTDNSCTCSRIAAELDSVNSHHFPENVSPRTQTLTFNDNTLSLTLPKYSATVLDFHDCL